MSPRIGDDEVREFLAALSPLLVREFRDALYEHLQPASPVVLRDGTYPLLTALRSGAASSTKIATSVGVDRSVITKQASVLESAGLLRRRADPLDARATLLELTPAGLAAAESIQASTLALVQDLAADDVSGDDLTRAARALRCLRQRLTP